MPHFKVDLLSQHLCGWVEENHNQGSLHLAEKLRMSRIRMLTNHLSQCVVVSIRIEDLL
jgi:hypothetical protein